MVRANPKSSAIMQCIPSGTHIEWQCQWLVRGRWRQRRRLVEWFDGVERSSPGMLARPVAAAAVPCYPLREQLACSHNDHMERNVVGARELKVRLGRYLRRVREGRTLVVTDRGRPVAELRPLGVEAETDAVLAKLEASGAITRPTNERLPPFRPIDSRGKSVSAAVIEDRTDRF